MKKRLSLLFGALLMCIFTFAQMQTPVKFKSELKKLSDNQLEVVFTGTIDEGWHVYSTGLGEDGPTSATFNLDKIEGAKVMGELTFEGEEIKKFDPIFEMNVRYFEKTVKFIQKLEITSSEYTIAGYLEFGACNDESCMPPTAVDFTYSGTSAVKPSNEVAATPAKESEEVKGFMP